MDALVGLFDAWRWWFGDASLLLFPVGAAALAGAVLALVFAVLMLTLVRR